MPQQQNDRCSFLFTFCSITKAILKTKQNFGNIKSKSYVGGFWVKYENGKVPSFNTDLMHHAL